MPVNMARLVLKACYPSRGPACRLAVALTACCGFCLWLKFDRRDPCCMSGHMNSTIHGWDPVPAGGGPAFWRPPARPPYRAPIPARNRALAYLRLALPLRPSQRKIGGGRLVCRFGHGTPRHLDQPRHGLCPISRPEMAATLSPPTRPGHFGGRTASALDCGDSSPLSQPKLAEVSPPTPKIPTR